MYVAKNGIARNYSSDNSNAIDNRHFALLRTRVLSATTNKSENY